MGKNNPNLKQQFAHAGVFFFSAEKSHFGGNLAEVKVRVEISVILTQIDYHQPEKL